MREEIIVKVEGEEWKKLIDKAFDRVIKKAHIDGFRDGKAPRSVYEKKYGIGELLEEALDSAIQNKYTEVINEGKIIPVIDVRIRFNQEPFEYTDRTCIIIINVKSTVVGLIVEKIAGVENIEESDIEPPPTLSMGNVKNKYVYGLGKTGDSVKLLLDPEKLIKDEDLAVFEEIADNSEDEE